LILCGICMTFIDAESNRSRITCIMVVAESDWMRIQNLPNRIGCGVKKRVRTPLLYTRCVWTGFWIFWNRTPAASNRIRSEVFFAVAGYGLDFVFTEKNVTGSSLDLYFPRLNRESDCLVLVGTGSGLDSDSKFEKQDWNRTQKNQSPNTSTVHHWYRLYRHRVTLCYEPHTH